MRAPGAHRARRTSAPAMAAATVVAAVITLCATAGAFALSSGPPPTPVPPSGSLSPFPQSLRTADPQSQAPHVLAAAAVLVDASTGQTLYAKASDAPRAVASLTKVMTALVTTRARKPS